MNQSAAEATRHEILRHSVDLFSHYGFLKTNISDIAGRAGMSPANLYRYFRNKQAIGLAVVDQHFQQSRAAIEGSLVLPGGTAEERVRAIVRTGVGHMVDELVENPKIIELAEFLCSIEEGLALLSDHIGWRRRAIAKELAEGMASGEIRQADPERLGEALLLATKVFWMPFSLVRWNDLSTVPDELEMVLDLVFEGLRTR